MPPARPPAPCGFRSRAASGLSALLIATQLAFYASPARAADTPADQIADALVAEAEARGAVAGDEEALKRLKLAFETSDRAAHGLSLARFLARSGRLLDALSVYRSVAGQDKARFRGKADADAAQQSKTELDALTQRIPRLLLHSTTSGVKLNLDSKDVAPDAWLSVEPGKHTVDASAPGYQSKHQEITLANGARSEIQLPLTPLVSAATPAPVAAAAAQPVPPTPAPRPVTQQMLPAEPLPPEPADQPLRNPRGSSQRLLGYITIGWGVAGLIGGGVTAYMAHQKRQGIAGECPNNVCDTQSATNDWNAANTLSTISTVGFVAGGGLTALGIAIVLTAPHADPVASAAHERLSALSISGKF